MIYLSFSGKFYPSIHYGLFPKFPPSEYRHIMEYVVNNKLNNKYDLKREGSVFGPAEIHFKLSLVRRVIKVEEVFYENGDIICDPKKIKKRTYEMDIDPTSDYRETIKQYKNNKVKSVVRSESNILPRCQFSWSIIP